MHAIEAGRLIDQMDCVSELIRLLLPKRLDELSDYITYLTASRATFAKPLPKLLYYSAKQPTLA
jgi:hypothetical protein